MDASFPRHTQEALKFLTGIPSDRILQGLRALQVPLARSQRWDRDALIKLVIQLDEERTAKFLAALVDVKPKAKKRKATSNGEASVADGVDGRDDMNVTTGVFVSRPCKRRRMLDETVHELNTGPFLAKVEPATLDDCTTSFIKSTSMAALASDVYQTPSGWLHCLSDLSANRTPKFGLANGLWLGEVPDVLKMLTLPERILLSPYLSAAYVVKLYPKANAAYLNPDQLNAGMRGNVTSYPLDRKGVQEMIVQNQYPRPLAILAGTIGITFIGFNGKPTRSLPHMFHVSRSRLEAALMWLMANHPFYAQACIDSDALAALPDDNVPIEILQAARLAANDDDLEMENGGYVPTKFEREDFLPYLPSDVRSADPENEDGHASATGVEPAVVPMLTHGMVDVGATSVDDSQLFAAALSNTAMNMAEQANIVLGSQPVNEYPRVKDGLDDDRFRRDMHFIFQTFGVIIKRQVCHSACLQIKRSTYRRNADMLGCLTPQDLWEASHEEAAGKPFSNPAIKELRSHLSSTRARVMGTDEHRRSVRSQIWGCTVMNGPPSLWVTINPSDIHDPLAQLLCGEHVDMDHFEEDAGPEAFDHSLNIAANPVAAAQFFHHTVKCILADLFGIKEGSSRKGGRGRIHRSKGILGTIRAYIGTVEAQGRGTLHLHLLLWLDGAPTAQAMRTALHDDVFRRKVVALYHEHHRVRGLDRQIHSLLPMLPIRNLVYDVWFETFNCIPAKEKAASVGSKANSGASEELPSLCLLLRGLAWYITHYATKKQQTSHNASAVLAKRLAYHIQEEARREDVDELNKRMLQRCTNALSREQEFSAPEVVSLLMGWGDRYISHHFVPIYLDTMRFALRREFPALYDKSHDDAHGRVDVESAKEILETLRDLLNGYQSFSDALVDFESSMSERDSNIIHNIDYFYLSSDAASAGRDDQDGVAFGVTAEDLLDVGDDFGDNLPLSVNDDSVTDEQIELAYRKRYQKGDRDYAEEGMAIANEVGLFGSQLPADVDWEVPALPAAEGDMPLINAWAAQLKAYIKRPSSPLHCDIDDMDDFESIAFPVLQGQEPTVRSELPGENTASSSANDPSYLNVEQRRAYDLVESHLAKSLRGERNRQLLMIVHGPGGTGKSALIAEITKLFAAMNASECLAKTATSGIAATRIGGQTLHSWAGIPARGQGSGLASKSIRDLVKPVRTNKRIRNMARAKYLIIDEYSMMSQTLLANLSEICCKTKCGLGNCSLEPFGGLNVILMGDLHQFPPIGKESALYNGVGPDGVRTAGRHLYEQFDIVVSLTQQMRVTDSTWNAFLSRLRDGNGTANDVEMCRKITLSDPLCAPTDFNAEPWRDAILVTPRHSLKDAWNQAAVSRHAHLTGHLIYDCPAEDTVGADRTPLRRRDRLTIAGYKQKETGNLPWRCTLAIGMKAMVTTNVSTEAKLANGSRGTVVDIVLDPRDIGAAAVNGRVTLTYPPACVFLRLDDTTTPQFKGLKHGIVPVSPAEASFNIDTSDGRDPRVTRRQLPIIPAYAFTDYKSQGQTIPALFVDLKEPAKNAMTAFNVYVALSRSHGRNTIRLLRAFNTDLLRQPPPMNLIREDVRLAHLNLTTQAMTFVLQSL
ncbi:hypothetical protein ONZ45_g5520 [Pleurotus djamor]|nr:hypothetical protein ONZ45_g5520 [Pleurotus djamor]